MTHQELVDLVQALHKRLERLEQNTARGFQRLHGSQLAQASALEMVGRVLGTQAPPPPQNPAVGDRLAELREKILAIGAELGVVVFCDVIDSNGHSHLAISVSPGTDDALIRQFNTRVAALNQEHGTYARRVGAEGQELN